MSELTKKILESGLVDAATASMMEKWGVIPEGSAELARHKELEGATKEQLIKFAEDIGNEVDKQRRLKETMLDLNQLRWPAKIEISNGKNDILVGPFTAIVDRMGRYYFQPNLDTLKWLVPGFVLHNRELSESETILEVTELFVGDQVAAIQVSTK
jgi:hypothetical protein